MSTPNSAMTDPSKGKTAPKAFSDRLRALASWLIKRADEPHNELTTRSMLRSKVEEALCTPNAEAQTRAEEKL